MANKLTQYFQDSWQELKKVVWPTRQETQKHTLMVLGISAGTAIFLGAVDFIFTQILQFFLTK